MLIFIILLKSITKKNRYVTTISIRIYYLCVYDLRPTSLYTGKLILFLLFQMIIILEFGKESKLFVFLFQLGF